MKKWVFRVLLLLVVFSCMGFGLIGRSLRMVPPGNLFRFNSNTYTITFYYNSYTKSDASIPTPTGGNGSPWSWTSPAGVINISSIVCAGGRTGYGQVEDACYWSTYLSSYGFRRNATSISNITFPAAMSIYVGSAGSDATGSWQSPGSGGWGYNAGDVGGTYDTGGNDWNDCYDQDSSDGGGGGSSAVLYGATLLIESGAYNNPAINGSVNGSYITSSSGPVSDNDGDGYVTITYITP